MSVFGTPPLRADEAGAAEPLPYFPVEVAVPDLRPWMAGNTGTAGFTTRDSGAPGPHVGLVALTHGNEIAGAIVLADLLAAGLTPARGRITFGFANLDAFARFDPGQPTASRFVEEDLNRLWDASLLDGPGRTRELERAREIRPIVTTFDILLDLHSMLWASEPLLLSGPSAKGRRLAQLIGVPPLIVADTGHVSGRRLIDDPHFADVDSPACAVLVEAGQHWAAATVETTRASVASLLRALDMLGALPDGVLPAPSATPRARYARVTQAVTAGTSAFSFVRPFHGGEVLPWADTLIALDGEREIRTPHDDCLLVMPSLRPSRGHTAVRLARFEE